MHLQHAKGVGDSAVDEERRTSILKLVVLSVNRCLIFLGDLCRYQELHGESSTKDWTGTERFYHQALSVLPTSGNPHNQLAVVATYTNAECVAVYRYCRSLMILHPFHTARENLMLLYEKNRLRGLPPPGANPGSAAGAGAGQGQSPGGSAAASVAGSSSSLLPRTQDG
ncbi:unnamed protein product, partial [Choristocarpus tenellus]